MNIFVGITDHSWLNQLRTMAIQGLDEVNFWRPSGAPFKALRGGEMLLFKEHAPRNVIAGGGFLSRVSMLSIRLAWEAFDMCNGASSEGAMLTRIAKYRRAKAGLPTSLDDIITCIILSEPFFFPPDECIPVPSDFSRHIQVGHTYSLDDESGRTLFAQVAERLSRRPARDPGPAQFMLIEHARFGAPHLVAPRLGQGGFRIGVLESYERRCAITGERTLPALEAGHIRPYSDGGRHELSNGILLRRDLHSLFDLGYLAVRPGSRQVMVSPRIRTEFNNGREYYALAEREIRLPADRAALPSDEALQYHCDTIFRG